ncbi:hypothetical protein DLAC_11708 [Tieghemostelium lacteum]|uniref:EGF-like domain-containing protein n=1 Tax=Tieghemostelium lacteum TaxID=361077 RepID=A0A151ZB32_TIELA|nr:hypothetical protein DLAC_11708 [Tieghemostelium lacteum]|eukprot:KYQ91163.1 hypothetical protein DLAC_11708 [Tieghemostelium lacteum]
MIIILIDHIPNINILSLLDSYIINRDINYETLNSYGTPACAHEYYITVTREAGDAAITLFQIFNSNASYYLAPQLEDPDIYIELIYITFTSNSKGTFNIIVNSITIGTAPYECLALPYPIQQLNVPSFTPFQDRFITYIELNVTKPIPFISSASFYSINLPYTCSISAMNVSTYAFLCTLKNLNSVVSFQNLDIKLYNLLETTLFTTISIPTFVQPLDFNPDLGYLNQTFFDDFLSKESEKTYNVFYLKNVNTSRYTLFLNGDIPVLEHTDSTNYIKNAYSVGNAQMVSLATYRLYGVINGSTTFKLLNLNGNVATSSPILYPIALYPPTLPSILQQAPIPTATFISVQLDITKPKKGIYINQLGTFYTQPILFDYPYNIISGNSSSLTTTSILYNNGFKSDIKIFSTMLYTSGSTIDSAAPTLKNVQLIGIGQMKVLVRVTASDQISGIFKIVINEVFELSTNDLASGSVLDGTFEKIMDLTKYLNSLDLYIIKVYDFVGNIDSSAAFNIDYNCSFPYISYSLAGSASSKSILKPKITGFKFSNKNVQVSSTAVSNSLFINFTNADPSVLVALRVFDGTKNEFWGGWDKGAKMYKIDFVIQPRPAPGFMDFAITYPRWVYYSHELDYYSFSDQKLYINSQITDRMPPLISQLYSYISGGNVTWVIAVEEQHNGLKNASFVIVGTVDVKPYVFTYTFDSFPVTQMFLLEIPQPFECITQTYRLTEISLTDSAGLKSYYQNNQLDVTSPVPVSPLLKVFSNYTQLGIQLTCSGSSDVTPPHVTGYTVISPVGPIINLASTTREFVINFAVTDSQNNLSKRHLPYCILYGTIFDQLMVESTVVPINYTNQANYTCYFNLPVGYGYYGAEKYSLVFTIHGYSDIIGNIGGSSYLTLTSIGNPRVAVEYNLNPIIESHSPMTLEGGHLTLYGRNFVFGNYVSVIVSYPLKSQELAPSFQSGIVLAVPIDPYQSLYNVTVLVDNKTSNTIQIQIGQTPTSTIIPVKCAGVPECGGPSNGECTSNGCVCKSPWIGNDCQSQVVTIDPTINTTNPETGNNYNTTLPNGREVQLKTLISIQSLRQLKATGEEVVNHPLYTWIYSNTTSQLNDSNIQEFTYQTNITNGNLITNVSVIVQYYKNQQTIDFANQKINILPSSMKYRIEISPYYFNSSINTLQLVMSAGILSNNDHSSSCSYQESGTTIDNEDYIKLQIDEHSLYAKFIKIGLVDYRVQSIRNELIQINNTQSTVSSNQLIGIHIPHFDMNVVLDPDFSLLVDTRPASDKDNALCESNESKGLTKAQLAGIIVGVTCGGLLLIGALVYILYRKNIMFRVQVLKLKPMKNKINI